jgi:hypothetical protein
MPARISMASYVRQLNGVRNIAAKLANAWAAQEAVGQLLNQ